MLFSDGTGYMHANFKNGVPGEKAAMITPFTLTENTACMSLDYDYQDDGTDVSDQFNIYQITGASEKVRRVLWNTGDFSSQGSLALQIPPSAGGYKIMFEVTMQSARTSITISNVVLRDHQCQGMYLFKVLQINYF